MFLTSQRKIEQLIRPLSTVEPPRLASSRPLAGRVVELEWAADTVRIVRIQVVHGGSLRFSAGQYARLTFGEHRGRDYSIASAPDAPLLEFHVRLVDGAGASAYVARELRPGDMVWIEGPFGDAYLRPQHPGPILAVAGGTGLAPVKSIVETALADGRASPIHLYYGARDRRSAYLIEHFQRIAQRFRRLRFIAVFEDDPAPQGRTVAEALAHGVGSAAGMKAYVAGPPAMVSAVARVLAARGLAAADLHTDAGPLDVAWPDAPVPKAL